MGLVRSIVLPTSVALATLLLQAFTAMAAETTPDARSPSPYRVAPGDRIAIAVFGQAEMSGEATVDSTASVAVPLLGSVTVRGLSLDEIQQRITQRLAAGYLQRPVVSVRLIEPRPIYVVGDVRTSGSYAYRYGISVMGAVALAGGFGLSDEQAQIVLRTDYLQAEERVRTLETTRLTLSARLARLEAQRDGRAPDFSALARGRLSGELLAETQAAEEKQHDFQTSALQQQLEMLEKQKPILLSSKQFLQDQLAAEKRQLDLIRQHLVEYNSLMNSGLARRYTIIELQREEARNLGNIGRFNAEMTNADLSMGEIGLRIREAREAFQRRVWTEIQETTQRLAELDAALPTARLTRELRLRQVGYVDATGGGVRRALTVTRQVDQRVETFPVTETAALEPGDILRIERERDGRAAPAPIATASQ